MTTTWIEARNANAEPLSRDEESLYGGIETLEDIARQGDIYSCSADRRIVDGAEVGSIECNRYVPDVGLEHCFSASGSFMDVFNALVAEYGTPPWKR